MQVVERHGGASHYVRPDRVVRTGVIPSIVGYSPGADVDAVAASFTQYPMDLQTPSGMNGLGAWPPTWWSNLKLKFAAWRAKHAASTMPMSGLRDFTPGAFDPTKGIAYPQVGPQIAPHMTGMAMMVAAMTGGALPPEAIAAQAATTREHWWNKRWNG
jgi:hypothetical protein